MSAPFWHLSPGLFAAVFGLIFLAELPDKTILATVVLATRNPPLAVFFGVAGAFTFQSLVAVAFGSVLTRLPPQAVRVAAALLFLGFAVSMWLSRDEEGELRVQADDQGRFWRAAGKSFVVIFLAEWGDLTQLATAALVAKHGQPLTVFLGATSALWAATALAAAAGHKAGRHIRPRHLKKAAAIVFALVGLAFLLR